MSKEAYLFIKASQAFGLLACLVITAISYGKEFLIHFSKVVFLVQTYCCVSSITLNVVQELKLSKFRLIQNRKQRQQLKILRDNLNALQIGAKHSISDQKHLGKSYSERTVIKRDSVNQNDDMSLANESTDEEDVPLGNWGRRFLKFEWFLRNICNDYAFTVSVMYYVKTEVLEMELPLVDKLTDICNSVQILLELVFSALPIRLFHVIYSYIFGALFLTYSFLMHSYAYQAKPPPVETDWDNLNINYLLGVFVAGVLACHLATFIIYFLRISIYIVYYKKKYKIKSQAQIEKTEKAEKKQVKSSKGRKGKKGEEEEEMDEKDDMKKDPKSAGKSK